MMGDFYFLIFCSFRLGKEKAVESDSDDDEENEKSVVIDDPGCLVSCLPMSRAEEGSSGSVSAGQSDGESSGGRSSESNLEEENWNSLQGNSDLDEGLGRGNSTADVVCPVEPESGTCAQGGLELGEGSGSEDVNVGTEGRGSVAVDADVEGSGNEATNVGMDFSARNVVDTETKSAIEPLPLNFDNFNSAAEMEVCHW